MSGVNGKVVAITRASSGIDEATALEIAARGAAVVLSIRHVDRLNTGRTNPRPGGRGGAVHGCHPAHGPRAVGRHGGRAVRTP